MNNWNAKIERWNGKSFLKGEYQQKCFTWLCQNSTKEMPVVPIASESAPIWKCQVRWNFWKCTLHWWIARSFWNPEVGSSLPIQNWFYCIALLLLFCEIYNLNSTFFHSLFWNAVWCSEQLIKGLMSEHRSTVYQTFVECAHFEISSLLFRADKLFR